MGQISGSLLEEMAYRLEYSSGPTVKVHCPYHADDKPSLQVSFDRWSYYCFGCGVTGSIVSLFESTEQMTPMEALILSGKLAAGLVKANPIAREVLLQDAYSQFTTLPKPSWSVIKRHYMQRRGFAGKTLKHFDVRLNQSASYPVIIPIYEQGEFRGYVKRRTDGDEPKYLYNEGFSRQTTIFGALRPGIVMIVEGSLDMMKSWQYGYDNVCATLGWKCSLAQARKIGAFATAVISATDNDRAGEEAWVEHTELFDVPVVRFPFPRGAKDVDEMTQEQFSRAISTAKQLANNLLLSGVSSYMDDEESWTSGLPISQGSS